MRASSTIRPGSARRDRATASRSRHAIVRRWLAGASCVLLSSVALLSAAEARLSVIPGVTRTPRPTSTPQVVGSKAACQETIRRASAELAGGVRAAFAECLGASLPCIFEQAGSASCCAAATPACIRESEEIAAAGAAFVSDVVAAPCSAQPFADLVAESGLDFGRTTDACLRLDPPVAVDGLGSLATCLARLVTQDVLHLVAGTEQPRALEALVCMDLENLFPGVLREFPATCEDRPAATPSPVPTSVPTPSPAQSPGSSPTPGASPGGPTPTPGSGSPTPGAATPTPQPTGGGATCTQVDVSVAVNYSQTDFPDVSGITVGLGYPQSVGIPGFGSDPTVLARVTNLTGVQGLFNVGDVETSSLLNVGVVSLASPVPPGDFARVRFDCATGATVPPAAAFTCAVDAATFQGNTLQPSQTQCVVTVSQP